MSKQEIIEHRIRTCVFQKSKRKKETTEHSISQNLYRFHPFLSFQARNGDDASSGGNPDPPLAHVQHLRSSCRGQRSFQRRSPRYSGEILNKKNYKNV